MIQTKPANIDEYIAGFPPSTQAALKKMRATIRKAAPEAEEKISYGINYCCSGHVDLATACSALQLDQEAIQKELEAATRVVKLHGLPQFSGWKLDFLIDYILHIHHAYLEKALPALTVLLDSFTRGHQKKYPHFSAVQDLFQKAADLMQVQSRYEEAELFPYIRQIEKAFHRKEVYGGLLVRTMKRSFGKVEEQQRKIGDFLEQLESLTQNYRFPENACTNYQVIYHKLKELHDDARQHAYLEQSFLFPKAIRIEEQLLQQ